MVSHKNELGIKSPGILVEMYEDDVFERVGQIDTEDAIDVITQEIAVDIFKACIGPSVGDAHQTVFDATLCDLIFTRLEQVYRPRTRATAVNPHIGYIYVVETPHPLRTPGDDKNILWVGVSEKPWITIERASNGLGSKHMVDFMRDLKKYSQEHGYAKLTWRKEEIIETYLAKEEQPTHAIDYSMLWLPWRIIDDNFAKQISVAFYVTKFKEEGHPVKNGSVGRPTKEK